MMKTIVEQKTSVPSEGLKVTENLELKDSVELHQLHQPYPQIQIFLLPIMVPSPVSGFGDFTLGLQVGV